MQKFFSYNNYSQVKTYFVSHSVALRRKYWKSYERFSSEFLCMVIIIQCCGLPEPEWETLCKPKIFYVLWFMWLCFNNYNWDETIHCNGNSVKSFRVVSIYQGVWKHLTKISQEINGCFPGQSPYNCYIVIRAVKLNMSVTQNILH